MNVSGKTLLKIALTAGAAYGAYYLYKNYIKKPQTTREFDDVSSSDFGFSDDAAKEDSLAEKIKAAAIKQLEKIV